MKTSCERGGFAFVVVLFVLGFIGGGVGLQGQNLVPNGGFEEGADGPKDWTLRGEAKGEWTQAAAHSGQRGLAIHGEGKGSGYWRSAPLSCSPNSIYRITFWARRETNATGGFVISGPSTVNRDIIPGLTWQQYQTLFKLPQHATNDFIRLGHWEGRGTGFFDDVRVVSVYPLHTVFQQGLVLGKGESVEGNIYHCNVAFGGDNGNYSPVLHLHRCNFNTDRWTFGPGAFVVYRHQIPGGFRSAHLALNVNYHTGGSLLVEASPNGESWLPVGVWDSERRTGEFEVPSAALSGDTLFVRLRGDGANCNLQVNRYELTAPLKNQTPDSRGMTLYLETLEPSPSELKVNFEQLEVTQNTPSLVFQLQNQGKQRLNLKAVVKIGATTQESLTVPSLGPNGTQKVKLPLLTGASEGPGLHTITVELVDSRQRRWFAGTVDFNLGLLADPRAGYWLAESKNMGLWWCESGWKIGRERPMPTRPAGGNVIPVNLSAARGEYEAAQVILRPATPAELRAVRVEKLVNRRGQPLRASYEWMEVAYVRVSKPTDATCEPGRYPDPLPPLVLPLQLTPGENQPLWLSCYVASDALPGDYQGDVVVETSIGTWKVPLRVTVYDFELPAESHLRSAFGLGTGTINRYHHLTNAEQRMLVYQMYLTNFARHRISPYSFFDYTPIQVRFTGTGVEKRAELDFSSFEKAASQWLDGHHFNSFRLPLRGMGGGTFHSRSLGQLEGFKEGTPEHARLFNDYLGQVERFLRERGWLSRAYTYWFDEPDPKDYEFVVEGMKRIKTAAPGLRRMLTEQPEPELLGHVDIWCGLTPEWSPEKVAARRASGEEVWWYICCVPHAPYITEFIDHPGVELRLWPWQSWQYGVQGILVWETVYWTSSSAFPPPKQQNPWEDPMSYVSGYDYKPGQIGYWGNGDGRFLYPPRLAMTQQTPCLEPPVTSFRWENLRDGMEDYEYFWLLQQRLKRAKQRGLPAALLREAENLLKVPETISRNTREFTTDPRLVLEHREKLARMIERFGD